jgi:diguanylate cyclase (GGDEF)-like protein
MSCLAGEHDLRLVVLAVVICFLTSFAAVYLLQRAREMSGRARAAWIVTAGLASGCGVWATHFIAVLAYEPGVMVAFDLFLTAVSFLAAAAFMTAAIAIGVSSTDWRSTILSGLVIGVAVATMHFIGMAALEVPGRFTWAPDLVIASLVLGAVFGVAAMQLAVRSGIAMTVLATVSLVVAIASLHFTAMGAIEILPDPARFVTRYAVSPNLLALGVAIVTALVLTIAAAASIVDQRMSVKSEQLEAALQNMHQGLCMLNSALEVVVINDRLLEMFKVSPDEFKPHMPIVDLMRLADKAVPFGEDTFKAVMRWAAELNRERKSGQTVFQRSDGRIFSVSHQHMPMLHGWVDTFEDITERRAAEDKIAHMARHDGLTGLPNRMNFREQLDKALFEIKRHGMFAVLCLDLDNFKTVNDALGHQAGDELLQVAAARLKGALRKGDLVARVGGDEFAILQRIDEQPAAARALAGRLIEVMRPPIAIGDQEMPVGVSVGVSLAPADGLNADQLLKNADMALYRAKSDGRGAYRFFEPGMDARMQARRTLELDLRRALAAGEFELHYQPIVNVATNEVTSLEALLRWRHPERGLVLPVDFIALAEETGLIVPIGEWVIRQACEDAAMWPAHVHVAVNLSPVQFKSANLVATVMSALSSSQLAPQRLELEITEYVLLQDSETTLATLQRLRGLGVAIAMDDFGTGYSSLSYLRKFPFDKIKIDQSFVRDLADNSDSLAIVRAVTGLGGSLGITTIADGVETAEQLNRLRAEGCSQAQGYLFGAPKPASEAIRQLAGVRPLRVVA